MPILTIHSSFLDSNSNSKEKSLICPRLLRRSKFYLCVDFTGSCAFRGSNCRTWRLIIDSRWIIKCVIELARCLLKWWIKWGCIICSTNIQFFYFEIESLIRLTNLSFYHPRRKPQAKTRKDISYDQFKQFIFGLRFDSHNSKFFIALFYSFFIDVEIVARCTPLCEFFIADKPFYFVITHRTSNIFIGRVNLTNEIFER